MLHIISAFHIEAKPLIEHFQLKKLSGLHTFESYLNDDQSLSMTISGLGKLNASAAVIYAENINPEMKNGAWLNFGIAGHKSLDIGSMYIANKVTDASSAQTWYPQIVFNTELNQGLLLTIDNPADIYPEDCAIDMEASGFYSSASKLGTSELIHCLKLISDNEENNRRALDKHEIGTLIEPNLEKIETTIKNIQLLQNDVQEVTYNTENFQDIVSINHFTHTEKLQLKKILTRWNALNPDVAPDMSFCRQLKSAKEIITYINNKTDELPIDY